ncbi:MAG: septal ring lytic transglycosylase RlpA family protein [Alphaproteobacteria bacterium]|nr:septal ring lytic transglycosylase RlpA family protein [Alphaproteobacteria bacterium]
MFTTIVCGLILSGCAETEFVVHSAKRITGSAEPQSPTASGRYKVGKPYKIGGVWYYPKVDYNYRETGIASWYGDAFHGKATANGEVFDMNAVSAAHRTLPLPSVVRVINLKNGRALKVRVNDRGPFAHGRIIDLSRRAAQLLGFERQGTAKVRVEIIAADSRQMANANGGRIVEKNPHPVPKPAPTSRVSSAPLSAPNGFKTAPPDKGAEPNAYSEKSASAQSSIGGAPLDETVSLVAVPKTSGIFVQAGAFARYENANRLRALLSSVGEAKIYQVKVSKQPFFRVRLGPAATVEEADAILAKVFASGYENARIIISD